MTTTSPLLLLLLLLFATKSRAKARPRPPMVPIHPFAMPPPFVPAPTLVHTTAPAWPSVMPAGLPPFPGPAWVPDSPPGPGVVARAFQLLPILWGRGAGATATEQTAGRWITYKAVMLGPKKSVIAYRLAAATVLPPIHPAAPPVAVPVSTSAPPVVHVSTAAPPAAGRLATLRLTHPNTRGPSVIHLQQRLGIPADGTFGSGTDAAVRTFQQHHGLTPDGIVGPATWAALG